MFTDDQKSFLINTAQELYRLNFPTRLANDPYAQEIDINTFKEACQEMSILVHYLAKEEYKIPDENNKVYHCLFVYNGKTSSHYFNKIYDRIVDSTIMQFEDLSPYDNHDNCYTQLEEIIINNENYKTVQNEIDSYETRKFLQCYKNNAKKKKVVERLIDKISQLLGQWKKV